MTEWKLEERTPDVCTPSDLAHPMARALAEHLERQALPFARMLECRQGPGREIVVLAVEVELAQHRVHDIQDREEIAVEFPIAGPSDAGPDVFALREGFPRAVPHLNLRPWEYPRSLCLYEVPFRDVRPQWTPARFVARIREWLRLTARGELHQSDQPLEPLLGDGIAQVILPQDIRAGTGAFTGMIADASTGTGAVGAVPLHFTLYPNHWGRWVLVASLPGETDEADPKFAAAIVRTAPRALAAIRRAPATLEDLHAMLAEEGDDLLKALRETMAGWNGRESALKAIFALVVLIPKQRTPGGPVEGVEPWVLLSPQRVGEVGEAIGLWQMHGNAAGILIPPDYTRRGAEVALFLGFPFFTLSRADAARYNGRASADDRRIVAIGAGSLGSQVIMNSVRAALGRWTVIDDDLLLPHNLARHALPANAVGIAKAVGMRAIATGLTSDGEPPQSIVADVLAPRGEVEEVNRALQAADVILDMSASVIVARMLARDCSAPARRVSLFLNPSGTDLTLLSEDKGRDTPLDLLEMQYYRALLHNDGLRDALRLPPARIRYGRSCRDVSVDLPQALAALHGGIAALALEQALSSDDAHIRIWRADTASLGVTAMEIQPALVRQVTVGGWTIVTDTWLLERLSTLREAKLPRETGGVLIGTFDLERRIAYIVDTIPSPPDSQEWPVLYIRGCVGLNEKVRQVEEITAGQLHYIGEWHSHPRGYRCLPSADDATVFSWLIERMDEDGLPALMVIAGDDGLAVPFLGHMVRNGAYPAELRPNQQSTT